MNILFEGQLERKTGFPLHPWKSVWVIIRDDSLEYSTGKGEVVSHSYDLSIATVKTAESGKNSIWPFTITVGKDRGEFATATEELRTSLLTQIYNAQAKRAGDPVPPSPPDADATATATAGLGPSKARCCI